VATRPPPEAGHDEVPQYAGCRLCLAMTPQLLRIYQ
jgi:hypothetical protein